MKNQLIKCQTTMTCNNLILIWIVNLIITSKININHNNKSKMIIIIIIIINNKLIKINR